MAGNDPAQPRVEVEVASRISAEVTIASSASEPGITFGAEIVRIVDGEESADKISFETGELDENQTCSWWTESLQPSNTYIARTFITNGRNRKYSERKTFTTPSTSKPTVSAVTLEGENLVASVRDNGGRSIEDVGFVAGDTPERKSLMRTEKIPAFEQDGGRFSIPLSLLEGGKTYYVIAYAIDDNEDVGYGATPLEVSIAEPSQPDGEKHERYLTFTSEGITKISLSNTDGKELKFYYSYNAEEWNLWDYTELEFSTSRPLFLCGDNPEGINVLYSTEGTSSFITSGNFFSVSGDIMSLLSRTETLATIPHGSCFRGLFRGCTLLKKAPELPATSLDSFCYAYMFSGCKNLLEAPSLPSTSMAIGSYQSMFEDCVSLEMPPTLPATVLANGCYDSMFSGCEKLEKAPALPALVLADNCYQAMFSKCSKLTNAPALPAKEMAACCYSVMFAFTGLTKAPELPASVLARGCYEYMFYGCENLVLASELPATELAGSCYRGMFESCSKLKQAPELPATVLAVQCYERMFEACALTIAPDLPAMTLAKSCYERMFTGCPLTTAPKLPATTLAPYCYSEMFSVCRELTEAPELPATVLSEGCYYGMFRSSGLSKTPVLPATTLAKDCYAIMFAFSELTESPELPVLTLEENCYYHMFGECMNLIQAPKLPAVVLSKNCYREMFYSCINLIHAPELPATTLVDGCYNMMFTSCYKIGSIKCLATDISAEGCTLGWLGNVSYSGTFIKAEGMEDWPTGSDGIPEGWTVVSE